MDGLAAFLAARETLWNARADYERAVREFRWPELDEFNWALDYFDRVPSRDAVALHLVDEGGGETRLTFGELSERSNRLATWLREQGVERHDRVLVMLGNVPELWETLLALVKLGAVIVPTSTLLGPRDLADRIERGDARAVVASAELAPRFDGLPGAPVRVAVGSAPGVPTAGWLPFAASAGAGADFEPDGPTRASDPLLLYFTSGTTQLPKLVEHTHASYPAGLLTAAYWLDLQPGDVHLNISSPGWAKHAWSCFFAPWTAEATVFVFNQPRFDATGLLDALVAHRVTSLCGPPTVWRMLIQQELGRWPVALRTAVGAGEPLNPEVISRVEEAWGLTIRDGYGQTETTLLAANFPGVAVRPGSLGLVAPGYSLVLLDADGVEQDDEGEICFELEPRPLGLMRGYRDDPARNAEVHRSGRYHTGDVARRDADGYYTYVGRMDDVFKASDYRISPFELESVLIEHDAVAEAAVVPSPDPLRLAVPKAFVTLAAGWERDAATAQAILAFTSERLAPYKRVRRVEFAELPKTISGKIRRVELREVEAARDLAQRRPCEWWEEDLTSG